MSKKNTRKEILENLRIVAGVTKKISRSKYRTSRRRKFATSTIESYFGSFTSARRRAGLIPTV